MFQTIPLNITGPTFQSRSVELSAQETVNFYQEVNQGGETEYVLMPWPGSDYVGTVPGTVDRGMTEMNNTVYRVVDEVLYEIDGGTHFTVGALPGTAYCVFANDGTNLFIAAGGTVYWYNGSIIQTVTDTDIAGASTVDIINNQFLYTLLSGLTFVSAVGDGSTADSLDGIGAEANPDGLKRDYVFNEEIIRFGTKSLERWYNSGVGRPPIERLQGQTQQVGLLATFSVARSDNYYYFLSDDRKVYQGQTGNAQSITPTGIANTLENSSIADLTSATGMTCTVQGQNFYILTVGNTTLALNESLGINGWFTLSESTGNPYQFTSIVYNKATGRHYCADGSDLYYLDSTEANNGTSEVTRSRITSVINADIFQQPGKRVQMSRFELMAEVGDGDLAGDATDPVISIESSQDGGRTWTSEGDLKIGWLGAKRIRGEWHSMKTFYDMILRISVTESVLVFPRSAAIDLRLAGR